VLKVIFALLLYHLRVCTGTVTDLIESNLKLFHCLMKGRSTADRSVNAVQQAERKARQSPVKRTSKI
jgi:hypothetical protein